VVGPILFIPQSSSQKRSIQGGIQSDSLSQSSRALNEISNSYVGSVLLINNFTGADRIDINAEIGSPKLSIKEICSVNPNVPIDTFSKLHEQAYNDSYLHRFCRNNRSQEFSVMHGRRETLPDSKGAFDLGLETSSAVRQSRSNTLEIAESKVILSSKNSLVELIIINDGPVAALIHGIRIGDTVCLSQSRYTYSDSDNDDESSIICPRVTFPVYVHSSQSTSIVFRNLADSKSCGLKEARYAVTLYLEPNFMANSSYMSDDPSRKFDTDLHILLSKSRQMECLSEMHGFPTKYFGLLVWSLLLFFIIMASWQLFDLLRYKFLKKKDIETKIRKAKSDWAKNLLPESLSFLNTKRLKVFKSSSDRCVDHHFNYIFLGYLF
jgi:hypothetical protein